MPPKIRSSCNSSKNPQEVVFAMTICLLNSFY